MTNQELQLRSIFEQRGYTLVKNFIDPHFAETLYEYLKFSTQVSMLRGEEIVTSKTVPGCICQKANDIVLDSLLKTSTLKVESITGLSLYPTYSMARIYTNGNELVKHVDRPACEISVTIKLSDTKNYNYPIFMGEDKFFLEDGDAVIYRGIDVEHWREKCQHDETYYLGQMFLHYVEKTGPHNSYKYDRIVDRERVFRDELWKNI